MTVTEGPTKLVRARSDLAEMIGVLAYYEKTTSAALMDELFRPVITSRFRQLPKAVQDIATRRTAELASAGE